VRRKDRNWMNVIPLSLFRSYAFELLHPEASNWLIN
jgi:hypothetical protein